MVHHVIDQSLGNGRQVLISMFDSHAGAAALSVLGPSCTLGEDS